MSWRQAVSAASASPSASKAGLNPARRFETGARRVTNPPRVENPPHRLILDIVHSHGLQLSLHERPGLLQIEQRIFRFNHQEKTVPRCPLRKLLHVENRVIRL